MFAQIFEKPSSITNDTIIDQINRNVTDLMLNTRVDTNYEDLEEGTSYGCYEPKLPKDSIDRLRDDLIERVLSYLTFSEKVLFESVSKQWKRVIYNKQTELHLNRSETESEQTLNKLLKPMVITDYVTGYAHYVGMKAIKKKSLESILKKCQFIKTVAFDCYCDEEDLQIIGKHCPHLDNFEFSATGFNEQNLVEFGLKYGYRLRRLQIYDSYYGGLFIKKFLNYCNNLTEVYAESSDVFIGEDKQFLPALQVMSLDINSENTSNLKVLSEKYYSTMKKLRIYCYNLIGDGTQTALTHISRLVNLEKLNFYISCFDENIPTIDEKIIELAKNCTKLKELDISIGNDSLVTDRILHAFGEFSSLLKLNLYLRDIEKKFEGSVECFKSCSNLKHLDIGINTLSDEFFDNINKFLPNLRHIDIDCESELTDKAILSLSKLEKLKTFYFRKNQTSNKFITDDGICQLISSCENIETISFSARPKITHKTIEALIGLASKMSKSDISFYCGLSDSGEEVEFEEIDLISFVDRIPQNLQINIVLGN